jgi:hypothetical protein
MGRYTMGNQCIEYEIIIWMQWNCHSHTSAAAAAAHCVQSEEFAVVFKKCGTRKEDYRICTKGVVDFSLWCQLFVL